MAEALEVTVPWPYLPPKSTDSLMMHFDESVYRVDSLSHLYRFVEALTGDSGAGDVQKKTLLARMETSSDGNNFTDLDVLFGRLLGVRRLLHESYDYNPKTDMLTSDQWDEVTVKDHWYRERALDFLAACQMGGTAEGIARMVKSVTGGSSDVYESWRYGDTVVGRSLVPIDNEVIVRPDVADMPELMKRTLLDSIRRLLPADTIVTIDPRGVSIHTPVAYRSSSADNSYFEVQKSVVNVTDLSKAPRPEYLPEEIYAGERWLEGGGEAPTTAFNRTQEYAYYHKLSTDSTTGQIDSIEYYVEEENGHIRPESPYVESSTVQDWSDWMAIPLADSPDNFPGGRLGQTPHAAPALTASGEPYVFPYASQSEFVETNFRPEVEGRGGMILDQRFRVPNSKPTVQATTYTPDRVVPSKMPLLGSAVQTSWFSNSTTPTLTGERILSDV